MLEELDAQFAELVTRPWAECKTSMQRLSRIAPVTFPHLITQTMSEAADALGLSAPRLVSGAFHDSIHLAGHCPTGMIFIPCHAGISHHPAERIELEHAVAGTQLLTATLARLAT